MANEPMEMQIDGPVFDGSGVKIMDEFGDESSKDIARFGVQVISDDLVAHIKHGTGHYVSNVGVQIMGDQVLITDNGVVYGPWLEGVSTRNQQTQFKGYSAFRRSMRVIQDQVVMVSNKALPSALRKLS